MNTTHQRLTTSARVAGLAACEFCHTRQCERCGAYGPCHTNSEYLGGHGHSLVTACHDRAGCVRRCGQ